MRVAVFADIHGEFLLPFKLVALYQELTGRSIDASSGREVPLPSASWR